MIGKKKPIGACGPDRETGNTRYLQIYIPFPEEVLRYDTITP